MMEDLEGMLQAELARQAQKAMKRATVEELRDRYWEKMDDRERNGFNEDNELVLVMVAAELGRRGASALC